MIGEDWAKSTHSNPNGACLEARQDGTVQVRDSVLGDASPVQGYAPAAWQDFLARARAGTVISPEGR